MSQTFRELSREDWSDKSVSWQEQNQALIIGCLQRIANALETLTEPILAREEKRKELLREAARQRVVKMKEDYAECLERLAGAGKAGMVSRIRDGLWAAAWKGRSLDDFPVGNMASWTVRRLRGVGPLSKKQFAEAIKLLSVAGLEP